MSWTNPLPTPGVITGSTLSERAFSALQAKYYDASSWATWAATLMENMTSSITDALSSGNVATACQAIITAIDAAPNYSPASLSFTNTDFSDQLLTDLKARLDSDIAAYHTGLGSTIEAAMFARATTRMSDERTRAYNEVSDSIGARGFDIPTGALTAKQTELNNESSKRMADTNEAILHETVVLAQQYNIEIIKVITQLCGVLGQLNDSKMLRNLEIQKVAVMTNIDVFKAQIMKFEVKGTMIEKAEQLAVEAALRNMAVEIEAFKGVAQSAAQMVASALNGISMSSSYGYNGQESHSYEEQKLASYAQYNQYTISGKIADNSGTTPPTFPTGSIPT